jgi:hypothetical protein
MTTPFVYAHLQHLLLEFALTAGEHNAIFTNEVESRGATQLFLHINVVVGILTVAFNTSHIRLQQRPSLTTHHTCLSIPPLPPPTKATHSPIRTPIPILIPIRTPFSFVHREPPTAGILHHCQLFGFRQPSVFGRILQCQPVRGVNTREECHWSHACSLQVNRRRIQWHPRV